MLLSKFYAPAGKKLFGTPSVRCFSTPKKVPAEMVKELRNRTSAGYADCQKALTENNLDMEAAIKWLRQKGALKAQSKAGRHAAEGLVGIASKPHIAFMMELNCETDFVARGDSFNQLAREIAASGLQALEKNPSSAMTPEFISSVALAGTTKKVGDAITETVAKLGENIRFRRALQLAVEEGKGLICSYTHNYHGKNDTPGILLGKIGALVALESTVLNDRVANLGRLLATHVAGMSPRFISSQEVTQEAIEYQKILYEKELDEKRILAAERKPFNPKKAAEDMSLLEQDYIFEPKKKVKDILKEQSKSLGTNIIVKKFERMACGEGIEKKEDNFAEEVAKMASTK